MEALPQLSLALTLGATLVAFDFAGSGKSGGEHVSLGYYERDDLKVLLQAPGCEKRQGGGNEKGGLLHVVPVKVSVRSLAFSPAWIGVGAVKSFDRQLSETSAGVFPLSLLCPSDSCRVPSRPGFGRGVCLN